MPDRSGEGLNCLKSALPKNRFLSRGRTLIGRNTLLLVAHSGEGCSAAPLFPAQWSAVTLFLGLLLYTLLFSACNTMPELYHTSVEAAVGRGDFNLVVDQPESYGPTARLVSTFMSDMGLVEDHIEKILGRSDRIALAMVGEQRRIALSGNFPAGLMRLVTKESRKEEALFRIEVPYSGMVLASSGDHRWMKEVLDGPPEEPFRLSSPAPGSLIFSLSDPAVLYRIDQEGYFLNMAEHNALLSVEGVALPFPEGSGKGWQVQAEMIGSDEKGSRRIASVMKTALFSLGRPKNDKPVSHVLSEIAGDLLKARAVERKDETVKIGPVDIGEEAMQMLLQSLKEFP